VINQQVNQLVQTFKVKIKHMRIVKSGVYRLISTDGKQHCLKKMSYTLRRLRWMDQVLRSIRRQGFYNIAWRNPHEQTGKHLYARRPRGGTPYILTPWIKGRSPSPASRKDIKACAAALARFHLAGRKALLPRSGALNMLRKWPSLLQAREELLKKQINKAKRNGHGSPMDRLLQVHGDSLLQRSQEALRILRRSNYKAVCKKAANTGALCHGDSGPKNFVLTSSGTYMIDFETLRFDLRAYDLFRMIRLSCKNKGWKLSTARSVLDGYQSVSKLERSDIELIKVWLQFPNKAFKLLSRYDRSKAEGKRKIEQSLKKVIADEQHIISFLEKLGQYVQKG
jgi:CotS family spore coat protein